MANYHINDKGDVKPCEAFAGHCPLNNYNSHTGTKEEAQKVYEDFMRNLDNPRKNVSFFFTTELERHSFTTGDCTHFAKNMQKKFGLPIFYLGDNFSKNDSVENRRWNHFVNQLPDGRFIDIEGIWTEKDLIKRWKVDELGSGWKPDSVNPADPSDMRKMGMVSREFPQISIPKTITKIKKHLAPIITLEK